MGDQNKEKSTGMWKSENKLKNFGGQELKREKFQHDYNTARLAT